MQQIQTGVAHQIKTYGSSNRMHQPLALAGDIQIRQGLRESLAENRRRVESIMALVRAGDDNPAHRIKSSLHKRQFRIAEVPGILLEKRRHQEPSEENLCLTHPQRDSKLLSKAHEAVFVLGISFAQDVVLERTDCG